MDQNIEYVTVDGKRLEVAWVGPAVDEAPILIFLHEGLGCIAMWRDFPDLLSQATGCGALIYSRAGYGHSDPCKLPRPVRYMHDEALVILPQLLELTGITDYILVGHSDGGSIAIIYAGGTEASGLRGVITEAAHVFFEEINEKAIHAAVKAYQGTNLPDKLRKYHGDNTEVAFRGWSEAWLHPDFKHWNLEEYVRSIKVPMLVMQGEDDEYGTLEQVNRIASQAAGGAETVILPDCGHSPHRSQKDMTLKAMTDFIQQLLVK